MATKTISIMDDVYELLVTNRNNNESFSQVIRRTLKKKRSIKEFAGAWKDMSDKDVEEMKSNIDKLRKRSTKELMEKYKWFV